MSNFTKPKGVRANGIPYGTQISAKADREVAEDGDSRLSKTYAIHIRLDYPCPSPRNSTTRMIDDKFVWEKLYECKGRANAVVEAGNWFRSVKKVSTGKILQGLETHECVVVDDSWHECSYGSKFNSTRPLNRLLDEETKKRVIEESKGNLKIADTPPDFKKGQAHPSLEWANGAKKVNDAPIKIGLNTTVDPSKTGMRNAIDKAVERASERKKKNQVPWIKEVESQEIRKLVRKMREDGTIEHSSAYRKRVGKRSEQPPKKKKKVSTRQKEVLKAELEEWIVKEEKKSLKRRKNKS